MSYDVVLKGFRLNLEETPAKVLERVLGLNAAKARKATQRFPVLLARTSKEKAERVAAALGDAGAIVEISEAEPDAPELDTGRSQVGLAPVSPSLAGASALAHAPTLIQRPSSEPMAVASALPYSSPDNDFQLESDASSYQLGELALDLGAPKAAPAPLPLAARAEPSSDVGGLELDMEAAPPSRRKAAAAPAPAEAPGTDGMQSFGDGFDDDVNASAPALELDAGPDFRKQQHVKVSSRPAPAPRRAVAPSVARQESIARSRPRTSADRVLDALLVARDVALHGIAFLALTAVTLLGVGYARSPDALFEAIGMSAPPASASVGRVAFVRPGPMPALTSSPRIHPLLRLAPEQLTVEVAHRLRDGIEGVERVPVVWPESAGLRARDVECVLIEQAPGDPEQAAYRARMHALLRTGHALAMPPEVAPTVRKRLVEKEREGRAAGFGELCLAL